MENIKTNQKIPSKGQISFLQIKQACFKNLKNLLNLSSYSNQIEKGSFVNGKELILLVQFFALLNKDQFTLDKCPQMRTPLRQILHFSQQYYQVLPTVLSLYLWQQFQKGQTIQNVDQILKDKIQFFGDNHVRKAEGIVLEDLKIYIPQFKANPKLNLFQKMKPINSFEDLLENVDKISQKSQRYLPQFKQFLQKCCTKGKYTKANVKFRKDDPQYIKLPKYIRIFQKIFDQLKRKKSDISNTFQKKVSQKSTIYDHASILFQIFIENVKEEINILKQENKITCFIADFLRGNCYFYNLNDFQQCINNIFEQAENRQYGIVQVIQRQTRGTCQLSFKIIIHDLMCQVQLIKVPQNIQLDLVSRQFIHTLYQIRRSPLGCTLGLYSLLTKFERIHLLTSLFKILKYCQNKHIASIIEEPINYFLGKLKQATQIQQNVIEQPFNGQIVNAQENDEINVEKNAQDNLEKNEQEVNLNVKQN